MGLIVEKVFVTDPEVSPNVIPTITLAKQHSIPLIILEKKDLTSIFFDLNPRVLCFSAGFKYIFPQKFIEHFNLILNVHGTLLPHYAGARTLNWIIENGETHSGVTVHKVDTGIDTGPILLQKSFEISPFDTGKSLYKRTLKFEPLVVEEALKSIKEEKPLFFDQVCENVRAYPNRVPEHSRIDPTKPLVELINKIRASDPESYPAFFEYCGEKLGVKLFRLNKDDEDCEDCEAL